MPVLPTDASVCALDSHAIRSFRRYLGTEHGLVYLDMRDGLHADALAALAGTLRAGGALLLHVDLIAPGNTLRRLFAYAEIYPCITRVRTKSELAAFLESYQPITQNDVFQLTEEQQQAFKALSALQAHVISDSASHARCVGYLEAPRGRGKSTLLGFWVGENGIRATFCAPSKDQAHQLLKHTNDQDYRFIPPDQLQTWIPREREWLIIDEAASIPAHILRGILHRAPRLILASTSEGYESAGRHFSLRLKHQLNEHYERVERLTLSKPIRWDSHDPLESLINATFCLHASQSTSKVTTHRLIGSVKQLCIRFAKPTDLSLNEFSHVFSLLMAAHYQSSPNDVRMLLEDKQQQLILGYINDELICACWLNFELPLSASLSEAVSQGRRRIPGHLLGQSLGYHLQEHLLMQKSYARIVRIVVEPEQQRKGLGSEFLRRIVEYFKTAGYFALGTSFGASHELVRFWRQHDFQLIRFGHKADAASGFVSALMLAPLTQSAVAEIKRLHHRYMLLLPFQAIKQPNDGFFYVLPAEHLATADQELLLAHLKKIVAAFCSGWIPFPTAQPALAAAAHYQLVTFPDSHDALLHDALFTASSLQELAKSYGFKGKKDVEQTLREVCTQARLGL
ncbi:hypothetical protein CWE11_11620 [Aliidiomarina sanyensis]|uniref:N-acetyltransferase domain-containing protein n=2 Tax=Aliidiomarina sanyensis TaxID=1249555 RepID=A0A432WAL6_9GAMM|nr:hypothetical protein CWE11_11620 [Aliidiomarina sanyensis]